MISKLHDNIAKKHPTVGTWTTSASAIVAESIAYSGIDFQIFDMEHGPADFSVIRNLVSACEGNRCGALVRLPEFKEWMVLQALDQGAHGVLIPHVETRDEVSELCRSVKYHPDGRRGFTPFSKAGKYTNKEIPQFIRQANESVLCGIIVESKRGIENIGELIDDSHLDIVYIGAYDLTQDLGIPGQFTDSHFLELIEAAVQKVLEKDIYIGGFVPQTTEAIANVLSMHMNFLTVEVDTGLIRSSYSDLVQIFHQSVASNAEGE